MGTKNQKSKIATSPLRDKRPLSDPIADVENQNMMQAVRLHGQGFENIHVESIPIPRPNDNQILVRVDAAGVCSSILKLIAQGSRHTFINGWNLHEFPVILGDEGCVTIVEPGKNVADRFPVGKRYATQPAVNHPPINHRERYSNNGDNMEKVAVGYSLPGHLSEYMLITEETIAAECLVPLPSDEIPFFAGALCEPLSCVISAQNRHVHLHQATPASSRTPTLGLLKHGIAVIIGAGPMGRLHAEAALRFSPRHLIIMDILEERLKWIYKYLSHKAKQTHTQLHAVLSSEGLSLLNKVSHKRGADDIIAAVGDRTIQTETQQWLAQGGVLNLFGGLKKGEHIIELDSIRVHYDEIRICGSSGGSPADVTEALRMVASNEIDPGIHLDMVGSLDQFPQALDLIKNRKVEGKIVLYPHIRQTNLMRIKGWNQITESAFLDKQKKA